jgi:hypothetical protein
VSFEAKTFSSTYIVKTLQCTYYNTGVVDVNSEVVAPEAGS